MANIYADGKKDLENIFKSKSHTFISEWGNDSSMYEIQSDGFTCRLVIINDDKDNKFIKSLLKKYDRFSRELNKRICDKKQEDMKTMKTQECLLELSKHRNLLPLIKHFLETCTRKENYGDNLHDFWLYVQDKKKYPKLPALTETWERSRYGNVFKVMKKPPLNDGGILKAVGCKSFPLSLHAFSIVPAGWWNNPEDTIPQVAKMVEESVLIKEEQPQKPQYIVLSLFD